MARARVRPEIRARECSRSFESGIELLGRPIKSCGMEQHKTVLELTEKVKKCLLEIFKNDDSDECGRRQLAAAIMELERFVRGAAAQADD